MANRQGKMQLYINYRMKVTLEDGRQMVGQMMAFDKHMNLVLADTEEFRRIKKKQKTGGAVESQEKRTLGLIILRGTQIVSLSVEGPPPADPSTRLTGSSAGPTGAAAPTFQAGPGLSKPVGRGIPAGLTGPAVGVGGPAPGNFPPGMPMGGPPGFPGRGGPPPPGFPGQAFPGAPPPGTTGLPPGFPQGFVPPGAQGRGYPPPGYGGR